MDNGGQRNCSCSLIICDQCHATPPRVQCSGERGGEREELSTHAKIHEYEKKCIVCKRVWKMETVSILTTIPMLAT